MAVWNKTSSRKPSGGLNPRCKKSKNYQSGSEQTKTVVGEKKLKQSRGYGGNYKLKSRFDDSVNVVNRESKTVKKVKILDVVENKANQHFVRQKIVTKGALIKTELGICKVTTRPGQNGMIDAVLVDDKKTDSVKKDLKKVAAPVKKVVKKETKPVKKAVKK